jgi:endoglucanase
MINVELLSKVCKVPGAPGYEQRIRQYIIELVSPLVDEVSTDAMGNVIALKKGNSSKKIMVAAHMDEISFIVTDVDKDGFVRFHTLGGFDAKTLTAQRVIIHGREDVIGVMGTKPIHVLTPEERSKSPKTTDFFIDTGLPFEKVNQLIRVGDTITRERELIEMGDCVNSKSLDNRVSVFILIEALRALQNKTVPYDIHAVFTVQEEVGVRGAIAAASGINPDFGIALDVTLAYDLPGAATHEMVTKLGQGTAIKVMDGATICDYRMVNFMRELAENKKIKHQIEVLPAGGTDTAGIQKHAMGGSIAGAISIPTRYLHQVIEMAHKDDIQDTIDLLIACLSEIDQYDWSFR